MTKKKLIPILLIVIVICLLVMILDLSFEKGLLKLFGADYEKIKKNYKGKTEIEVEEPQEENPDLAKGPDWWLVYNVPSCFTRKDLGPEMGAARIHFQKGKAGEEIIGTSLKSDAKVRFTGTYESRHLKLIDHEFFQKATVPLTMFLSLDDEKHLSGSYKAEPIGGNWEGCPGGNVISGPVVGCHFEQRETECR